MFFGYFGFYMCIYDYVHVYVYCVSVIESIVLYFFNKNIWGKKRHSALSLLTALIL